METIKTIYKIGKGPSSSHTIGPDNAIRKFISEFDIDFCEVILYGSLALTGKGHLTDFVIENALNEHNIKYDLQFNFKKSNEELGHPNSMLIVGYKEKSEVASWLVHSVGGGNIVINNEISTSSDLNVYPHSTFHEIQSYCKHNNLDLVEYIDKYDVGCEEYLNTVLDTMIASVENGLSKEGVIHGELQIQRRAKKIFESAIDDDYVLLSSYAYAVSEENATGGVIVTAPTCGACGIVPALLYYYFKNKNVDRKKLLNALKIAGLFGTLVRENGSISGAEAGCQAEVGTATAMASAAAMYVEAKNPTLLQIESAAEIGLEHSLGLTCDPILGYVQIPCIQRNAVSIVKAISAYKIALVSSDMEVVDFDTIVKVMYETGKDMNSGYRETSQLGLAKYFKNM